MRTRSSEACGCGSGTTKEPSVIVRSRDPARPIDCPKRRYSWSQPSRASTRGRSAGAGSGGRIWYVMRIPRASRSTPVIVSKCPTGNPGSRSTVPLGTLHSELPAPRLPTQNSDGLTSASAPGMRYRPPALHERSRTRRDRTARRPRCSPALIPQARHPDGAVRRGTRRLHQLEQVLDSIVCPQRADHQARKQQPALAERLDAPVLWHSAPNGSKQKQSFDRARPRPSAHPQKTPRTISETTSWCQPDQSAKACE